MSSTLKLLKSSLLAKLAKDRESPLISRLRKETIVRLPSPPHRKRKRKNLLASLNPTAAAMKRMIVKMKTLMQERKLLIPLKKNPSLRRTRKARTISRNMVMDFGQDSWLRIQRECLRGRVNPGTSFQDWLWTRRTKTSRWETGCLQSG